MLRSAKRQRIETSFEKVCRLARQQDIAGLNELVASGERLHRWQGGCTPVMLLAREGNHQAVRLLINSFNASIRDALQSYAKAGLVKQVEELLAEDMPNHDLNMMSAVGAYAEAGLVNRVENLLGRGAHIASAVRGYAKAGLVKQVDDLLDRGASIEDAVFGYGSCGSGGYFANESDALRILSLTNDAHIREQIAAVATDRQYPLDFATILEKAVKINKIMRDYHLDYSQAQALQVKGLRAWFLQGEKKNTLPGRLPHDVFIELSTFVAQQPHKDTRKIYAATCENTYKGADQRILNKRPNTFFAQRYGIDGKVRPARHKRERADLDAKYYPNKERRFGR